MSYLLTTLEEVLKTEISVYKEMLALSKDKKDALIKNSIKDLDVIIAKEQAVLKRIEPIESKRQDITDKIAVEFNIPQEELCFSDIIDISKGEQHEGLVCLKAEMEEVISKLSGLNMLNKVLIDTHLKYSSFCMNVLTGYLNMLNTYSHSGQVDGKRSGGYSLLDQSV